MKELTPQEKEELLISIYHSDEFNELPDKDTLEELLETEEWNEFYKFDLDKEITEIKKRILETILAEMENNIENSLEKIKIYNKRNERCSELIEKMESKMKQYVTLLGELK